MSRSRGPGLLFQSQHIDIHDEGYAVKKTSDTSKPSQKKAGGNFGVTRKPLQNISNSGLIHKEGPTVKKTSDDISKTIQKKVGGNRKALQDVSNISVHQDAAKKKNNLSEKKHLHNSKHCVSARKAELDQNAHDAFLFEHGLLHPEKSPLPKEAHQACDVSQQKYLQLEPIPELPISGTMDFSPSPIQLESPSRSDSLYKLPELKKSVARAHEVELSFQDHDYEGFEHDHSKCIEAQKAQMDHGYYYDMLFEHGLLDPVQSPEPKEPLVVTCDSPLRYLELEELPELPWSKISDWCPSPVSSLESPPFSPMRFELPELKLRDSFDDELLLKASLED